MKTTTTLVEDIYHLAETKEVPEEVNIEAEIDRFGENVKTLISNLFTEKRGINTKLRMSSIGKGDRYLWNTAQGLEQEEIKGPTHVKFMYGHLIEEMLIFLTRASGHLVTNEQEEVIVEGIKGHIDCLIDGELTDIKSASSFSFKKFKEGTLVDNDPFGYIDQIKGYAEGLSMSKVSWLAMDKQHGSLTFLQYDLEETKDPKLTSDIKERINTLKDVVKSPVPPKFCFDDVPDGKSGNRKLATGCSYCGFKHHCYPDLRVFHYSTGPKYLTKVARQPKVTEEVEF